MNNLNLIKLNKFEYVQSGNEHFIYFIKTINNNNKIPHYPLLIKWKHNRKLSIINTIFKVYQKTLFLNTLKKKGVKIDKLW